MHACIVVPEDWAKTPGNMGANWFQITPATKLAKAAIAICLSEYTSQ